MENRDGSAAVGSTRVHRAGTIDPVVFAHGELIATRMLLTDRALDGALISPTQSDPVRRRSVSCFTILVECEVERQRSGAVATMFGWQLVMPPGQEARS